MSPIYLFQYLLYSFCIYLFILYSYVVYYGDLFSLSFRDDLLPQYDYVIVGSGTAGSVIARLLTAETNSTFIVLEAGSRGQFLMDIPIVGPAMHRSLFDWMYETVPQENACWAMKDKKCRLPQGKVIGGSSKLNNMIHYRGNIEHYMQWFRDKYSKEDIEQQFELIEKDILYVNDLKYESTIADAILRASKELGFNDFISESGLGFTKSKLSQRNGKRWSPSDNLDISKYVATHAFVEKVMIKDKMAKGVSFLLGGKKKTVKARKGVILSAGALNTPKILQLSGIGPSKLLKSLQIPIIQDLPVGDNLQDHIGTGLDLILLDKFPNIAAHDIVNPLNSIQYFLRGKGPLTTPGCEVLGFVSTKNLTIPDLQFMVLPMGISSDRGSRLRKSLGVKDDIWNEYFVKLFDNYTASMVPIILHPKSKGTVYIKSTDPKDPPLINPNYLSHEDDREILIKGLKLVVNFLKTCAMKDIGAHINALPFPSCKHYVTFSDKYWDCYIKHMTLSSYHPVGTCSMGSVVDTNFKVYGINKLFVADSSVLPTLPSGNINAAVAMMASTFFYNSIVEKTKTETDLYEPEVCFKDDLPNVNINDDVAMMANTFFGNSINGKYKTDVCFKNDSLNEFLLQVCLV